MEEERGGEVAWRSGGGGEGGGGTSFIKAPLAPERNSLKCMKNILDYS